MITPFTSSGELDFSGAARLAKQLVADGNDGLVVSGSTGESAMLDDDERIELWRVVAEAVTVPVVAGSTTGDTRHSVELTKEASKSGVSGILATTPYYSRPSQHGIAQHFQAVAEATDLPVILYDIPSRTGRRLSPSTVLGLASEVSNVVGLKDASGDPAGSARLYAASRPDFAFYSGDDSLTLALVALGASGVISVAAHWCAAEFAEMIAAYLEGDVDRALAINTALLPSYSFQSSDDAPNPLPTKAVMRTMNLPAGQCRLPLGDAPATLDAEAEALLATLRQWRASRTA
jgi:4-hydroxy-tetrahydrodipicolinate synthase